MSKPRASPQEWPSSPWTGQKWGSLAILYSTSQRLILIVWRTKSLFCLNKSLRCLDILCMGLWQGSGSECASKAWPSIFFSKGQVLGVKQVIWKKNNAVLSSLAWSLDFLHNYAVKENKWFCWQLNQFWKINSSHIKTNKQNLTHRKVTWVTLLSIVQLSLENWVRIAWVRR